MSAARSLGVVLGVVLLWCGLAGVSYAQQICYQWTYSTCVGRDPYQVHQCQFRKVGGGGFGAPAYFRIDSQVCTVSGPPTGSSQQNACTLNYTDTNTSSTGTYNITLSSAQMAACPPPPGCDQNAPEIGKTFSGSASSMATRSYCHAVNNCLVSVKASAGVGGSVIYTGTVTNQNCPSDGSAPSVSAADLSESERCVAVGDGSYCVSPKAGDGSCGYLNSTFVCLQKVKADECKPLGDGGAVCGASAGTPPAPDNGTRGQAAAPTGSIEHQASATSSNTYNYYNSTTVSGSSVAVGDGSNPVDTGGSPGGNGEGLPEGGGSASGGIGCDAAPQCEGDPIACNALYQAWRARCPGSQDGDLAAALGEPADLSGSSSEVDLSEALDDSRFGGTTAGACPAPPTITLPAPLNFSFTFDVITWLCLFAGQISTIVLAVAYMTAARIVGGAL